MASLKLWFAPEIRERRRCCSSGPDYGCSPPPQAFPGKSVSPRSSANRGEVLLGSYDEKFPDFPQFRMNRTWVVGLRQMNNASPSAELVNGENPVSETLETASKNTAKLKNTGLGEISDLGSSPKRGRSKFVRKDADLEASMSSLSQARCNSILNRLEQDCDEKVLQFFELMRENGKLEKNPAAYAVALRAWARKGDWPNTEALLAELSSFSGALTPSLFNSLLLACNRRGSAEIGANLLRTMIGRGIEANSATFAPLLTLYQKTGRLKEAELAFDLMRSREAGAAAAYSAMITLYTRHGRHEDAERVIRLMVEDRIALNSEAWLVRINAYSQQGKLKEASTELEKMKLAGFHPNIVAYNTLITGYGKISDSISAMRVFRSLRSLGLKPDATTYRSMIEGLGRAGNYEEVKRLYSELKSAGFRPSSANFFTMINLQAKLGDNGGAVQTLLDMRSLGCELSSILGILLQAYERAGRVLELPREVIPVFYEEVLADQTSCSMLALAFSRAAMADQVLGLLRGCKWTDPAFEDNLYHLLICSCKDAGRLEDAVAIFSQLEALSRPPNLHIWSSMIDVYARLLQFQRAETLHLQLKSAGVQLDLVAYAILVRMYANAGLLHKACEVIACMELNNGVTPDVFLYRDMLRVYQRLGMKEKLAELYYRLRRSGLDWDEAMYNCVINCCARALPVDELSRLFEEMTGSGFAAGTVTVNVMIDVYCRSGLLVKARKVLAMARKQGLADAISFNTIIAAYGRAGEVKRMQHMVRQMVAAGISVSLEAYNTMLDAYGKADMAEEFKDVMKKMKEMSCSSDHYTYNILINIYGRKGWIEEVGGVLSELRERGMEPDLYGYNTLIKAYGVAGMVEEAVGVVREMRERGVSPDRVTFSSLVSALQRNEQFLEAVKWDLWMKQVDLGD
ncbi:tetratricopeptide repeat (TPR)-like superfamily protein [Wolffia australiana]